MEAITRLVADSLARHGLDRPVDPRRLQWSRWFRCDSPHSLLVVPSKPGIFAIAEEVMDLGVAPVATDAFVRPDRGSDRGSVHGIRNDVTLGGAAFQHCDSKPILKATSASDQARRMLAVLQFSEDDDMAFTLDRMFTCVNPMRARLATGRCFLRFVVIEDQPQRRSICNALNQWMLSSAEKATGIPAEFSSSLELAPAAECAARASASIQSMVKPTQVASPRPYSAPPHLDSGAAKNLHCPQPLPSGF